MTISFDYRLDPPDDFYADPKDEKEVPEDDRDCDEDDDDDWDDYEDCGDYENPKIDHYEED